eukprot:gene9720-biopygen3738
MCLGNLPTVRAPVLGTWCVEIRCVRNAGDHNLTVFVWSLPFSATEADIDAAPTPRRSGGMLCAGRVRIRLHARRGARNPSRGASRQRRACAL